MVKSRHGGMKLSEVGSVPASLVVCTTFICFVPLSCTTLIHVMLSEGLDVDGVDQALCHRFRFFASLIGC